MTSIRGRSRPEADRYVEPNKRASTNRGHLQLDSMEFNTLLLAKERPENRVTSIGGRSFSNLRTDTRAVRTDR